MALEQKWRFVELDAVIATKTYNVMVSILRLSGFSVCIPYREGDRLPGNRDQNCDHCEACSRERLEVIGSSVVRPASLPRRNPYGQNVT